MFKQKDLQLLIIQGEAGTGKTQMIQHTLEGEKCFMQQSHSTPLALFNSLYEHRNELIVLEDLDTFLRSSVAISMMKALCETTKVKKLSYLSTSQLLKAPINFETASSILISCNQLQAKSKNMQALLSRGLYLQFEPTRLELLNKMIQILPNINLVELKEEQRKEVLGFIEKNEPYASSLNLRHLVRGLSLYSYSLKDKSFDWKSNLEKLMGIDVKLKEVLSLIKSGKPVKEQVKAFSGSRASFYRARKKVSNLRHLEK